MQCNFELCGRYKNLIRISANQFSILLEEGCQCGFSSHTNVQQKRSYIQLNQKLGHLEQELRENKPDII